MQEAERGASYLLGPSGEAGCRQGQGLPGRPVCGRRPVMAAGPLVGRVPALALLEPGQKRGSQGMRSAISRGGGSLCTPIYRRGTEDRRASCSAMRTRASHCAVGQRRPLPWSSGLRLEGCGDHPSRPGLGHQMTDCRSSLPHPLRTHAGCSMCIFCFRRFSECTVFC